jgi:hypothetical protein
MTQTQAFVNHSPKITRSSQMIHCLRSNLLYSDKRMRDILFRAASHVVRLRTGSSDTVMLSRLTREMEVIGREWGTQDRIESNNWDMPAKAVVNTMIRAGVLFDRHGTPIPAGVGANASAIAGIADQFEDRCEAFLIEFLIRKLGNVTTRDHKALAYALFRRFDPSVLIEDLEDRAIVLISRLEGSVILADDGLYIPADLRVTAADVS